MTTEGKELQFIRTLIEAWDAPDRREALSQALQELKVLSESTSYKENYAKFSLFLDEIETQLQADPHILKSHFLDLVEALLVPILTDTWEGSSEDRDAILALCETHPMLSQRLNRLRAELEPIIEVPELALRLRKGDDIVAEVVVSSLTRGVSIPDITPGSYSIETSTGRILWSGDVPSEQVLWTEAYPERDLQMAAQTDEAEGEPTRMVSLLDDELELSLYPGVESGTLRLTQCQVDG